MIINVCEDKVGGSPPYLLIVEPSCFRNPHVSTCDAVFSCIFLDLCVRGFFSIVGYFYFPSVAVVGSDVLSVTVLIFSCAIQ